MAGMVQKIFKEHDINNIFRSQKDYDDLVFFINKFDYKSRHTKEQASIIYIFERMKAGDSLASAEKKVLKNWLQVERQKYKIEKLSDKKQRNLELLKIQRRKEDTHKKALLGGALLSFSKQNNHAWLLRLAHEKLIPEHKWDLYSIHKNKILGVDDVPTITYRDQETNQLLLSAVGIFEGSDGVKKLFHVVFDKSSMNVIRSIVL